MTADAPTDLSLPTKLVLQGEPPESIARFFASKKATLEFYSRVKGEQYGVGQVSSVCSACQQSSMAVVSEFEWHALFGRFSILHFLPMLAGHLTMPVETEVIGFSSFHGLCKPCWRRYRRRKAAARMLEGSSFFILLVGLAAAIGFGAAPFFEDKLATLEKAELFGVSAGGLFLLVLSYLSGRAARSLYTPAWLSCVAPPPFLLHSTKLMEQVRSSDHPAEMILVPKYRPPDPGSISWQFALAILLVVFALLPTTILAFADNIQPAIRYRGRIAFWICIVLIVVLVALGIRRRRRNRAAYYQRATQLAGAEADRG
jgi:hypothetical protein